MLVLGIKRKAGDVPERRWETMEECVEDFVAQIKGEYPPLVSRK
jgi:hypothetical protein